MKHTHFERIEPICPRCRRISEIETPLTIAAIHQAAADGITQGILQCSNLQCRSEYPIIDGIPVIVDDLRTCISQNILPVLWRTDLQPEIESLLGDCCGPASAFNAHRQNLSSYTFDHYGDLDPAEDGKSPAAPGCILAVARKGIDLAKPVVRGPVVDIGCSVGRTTFELATHFDELILGIDLGFDMLRTASQVLETGRVRYPRRRVGMAYDRREFQVNLAGASRVDFWCCDAAALPLPSESVSLATSFNVIDCVTAPYDHLQAIERTLAPGSRAILSTPYDWSATATPVEAWLGGHSQRSEKQGDSATVLKSLLAGGDHPLALAGLKLVAELPDLPWSVRLHDRSCMQYRAHLVVIEAVPNMARGG